MILNQIYSLCDEMMDSNLLQCAAFHGLTEMVELLLPDVVQSSKIMEALCAASERGHITAVKLLQQNI